MFFFFTMRKLIKIWVLSILFYFDIDNIDFKFWLIFRLLAEIECDKKKPYLLKKNQYLIRDPSPLTFPEIQRSDRQSCCKASIAKQNRFSFVGTNKIQRSTSGAGSSLQNPVFEKNQEQKEQVQAISTFFHHYSIAHVILAKKCTV